MRQLTNLFTEYYWPGIRNGILVAVVLGVAIAVGSQRGRELDRALLGYTSACLFSAFGVAYRFTVWLSKPPTQRFWHRGWQLAFSPRLWRQARAPRIVVGAVATKLVFQTFIARRGIQRWVGHLLLASGCTLAVLVTFPLVFGWIHFEQGDTSAAPSYRVIVFGQAVQVLVLDAAQSWFMFHALVIASVLVIPGVMLLMHRRILDEGTVAIQRFGADLLPLILLFAVAVSGLLLWVSYEWLDGYFYVALAQFHAFTVIGTLLYLPFGKLFHIFQRPASLGVALYRAAGESEGKAECPVSGEAFASKLQVADVKEVLGELGFDYQAQNGDRTWQELAPVGRRRLIARAQSQAKSGRFA